MKFYPEKPKGSFQSHPQDPKRAELSQQQLRLFCINYSTRVLSYFLFFGLRYSSNAFHIFVNKVVSKRPLSIQVLPGMEYFPFSSYVGEHRNGIC